MFCSFGAVPVTGGAPAPSVLRSPKVSPLRGGAAHGPLHPALFPSTVRISHWLPMNLNRFFGYDCFKDCFFGRRLL